MPADAAQLLFLGGIVCLIISQHSRWWTQQLLNDLSAQLFKRGESNEQIRVNLALFLSFARYPLIFASMAGYFVCFWPGERPIRRILGWVCFPAILSLGAIWGRLLYISIQPVSVLESSGSLIRKIENRRKTRSEEHTSELQSLTNLVCRLLLEKKKEHQVATQVCLRACGSSVSIRPSPGMQCRASPVAVTGLASVASERAEELIHQ